MLSGLFLIAPRTIAEPRGRGHLVPAGLVWWWWGSILRMRGSRPSKEQKQDNNGQIFYKNVSFKKNSQNIIEQRV